MLWIILCILAASAWGLAAFIDNYQTDVIFRGKSPQSIKLINGPLYIIISIILVIVFRPQFPELWQIGLLILSGCISSIGTFAYYQALKHEEPTGAAIFYQLQPVMFLVADYLIFHEEITPLQIVGLVTILLAPFVIIFSRKRAKARRMEKIAAFFLVIYVAIATVSAELCIRAGAGLDFTAIIPFYIFGRGMTDCFAGVSPKLRRRNRSALKRYGFKYIGSAIVDSALCATADCCYRFSLIVGVSAIVSAFANAAELIITFLFGIVLSIIWPNFGREKLQRRIVLAHAIGVILCIIGLAIIQ